MPREFKGVLHEKKDQVARITINRPKEYNAFTGDTLKELTLAFEDAATDEEVGVVVLTGAGDKAFCAGGDVNWEKEGGLDAAGYVSITGRSKDLIIRGGENLSPAEVENLLFTHLKVAGVAVVGMPDPRLGERMCAFVIPRPGETVTLGELVAHLEGKSLARQKLPERLEVVAEFPMTPSGKIQKYRLRQLLAEKLRAEGGV